MTDYLSGEQTERILTGRETALKVWREARGLSVAELAAAAHVPVDTLTDLEDGQGSLDGAIIYSFAGALGVPSSWIERELDE